MTEQKKHLAPMCLQVIKNCYVFKLTIPMHIVSKECSIKRFHLTLPCTNPIKRSAYGAGNVPLPAATIITFLVSIHFVCHVHGSASDSSGFVYFLYTFLTMCWLFAIRNVSPSMFQIMNGRCPGDLYVGQRRQDDMTRFQTQTLMYDNISDISAASTQYIYSHKA